MSISDKKRDVIYTLQASNDETLIDEIYELLHPDKAIDVVEIKDLPAELQQKISKAMDDYRSGRYITHTEMKQKVQQWLMK